MNNLSNWFDKGISAHQYINTMKVNKESTLKVFNEVSLTSEETRILHELQNLELKAVVITADWCGDAMVNLPIFIKLANEAFIEARFLDRDENLELMDQYLTNGTSRSIPIIILLNKEGIEIGKWGPRAEEIQVEVDQLRAQLPAKDSEEYDLAFKEFIKGLVTRFTTDQSWWELIKKDLLKKLTEVTTN
ncbi:thioredoxin family protein [Litchfieldia alkalitelluris]|uniref:thioredoxin family protein n=1 Tax=Litchfieldia alkalitelluris TaxID=304268 RepID=UPI0009978D9B|nr:thioredoxin family protein [Litchfieldia alkalitelluris]